MEVVYPYRCGLADASSSPQGFPNPLLSAEVPGKMHAPDKPTEVPVLEDPAVLEQYDGFLFGIPTRYGRMTGRRVHCMARWRAYSYRRPAWVAGRR